MPPRAATTKPRTARKTGRAGTRKSPAQSPAVPAAVPLVPQPHGGALRLGSGPGNTPGTGRPRSQIRDRLAAIVDEDGVDFLRGVVRGEVTARLVHKCEHCGKEPAGTQSADDLLKLVPAIADRVAAVDKAARYGIGTTKELTVEHVSGRLEETYRVLHQELDAETFARIDARLAEVWR